MKKSKQGLFRMLFLLVATLFLHQLSFAQAGKVTGTVQSADGKPLVGVEVSVKDGQQHALTDENGSFSIEAAQGDVLGFSYIGFAGIEQTVSGSSMTVTMTANEAATAGSDVVVTALGIKRESKSLGYGVQEIKGEVLADAQEPNVTNALSGKVAGLQVVRSSHGPAGSSKIVLRGYNSLTGDNQPLIVVDGTPIDNNAGVPRGGTNDFWNPSLDMGNGLSDINAEDIASVSVLKGPAAAALYGSRAGNGVILITTKTGKKQNGLGIKVSSSLGFESIFTNPDMQSSFGQGENGAFDVKAGTSWGPAIEGQSYTKWDGSPAKMQAYDNIGNYYETGIHSNQSVSFSQQYNKTSIYTSFNRLDDKSMIPESKYSRTNLMARAISKFGKDDKWTLDTKIQYNNSKANNRPISGVNTSNVSSLLYMLPRSLDIRDFSGAVDENGKMTWYTPTSSTVNPYWASKYNLNEDVRKRIILTGSLKYDFTDWLNAEIKGGGDIYNTATQSRTYAGSPIIDNGQYSQGSSEFQETNYSFMINAVKDNLFGKFGGLINFGGNLMDRNITTLNANSGKLEVPDLFALNNGVNNPTVSESHYHKKINSLYGSLQMNWDGYLFLDATLRNDWISTLSKANRSYYYPSLSLSYVFTDMIRKVGGNVPSWFTYGKLRGSYAEVGNGLEPYQLYNLYSIGKDPNGNTTASPGTTLFNPNAKSELIKSYEFGTELKFFKSRLGVDFSWYKTNSTQQLIPIPLDPLSGYARRMINAGNIQNSGFEAIVNAGIFQNPDGFNWNMAVNFSKNSNKIIALTPEVDVYSLGGYDDLSILAMPGQDYGVIYGSAFSRVDDPKSKYFGELLLDETGLPTKAADNKILGNQQPDFLLGVTNTFSYKGVNLSFLLDGRFGGEIYSATYSLMEKNGTAGATVVNGKRDNLVVPGVISDGNGGYVKNTMEISNRDYWKSMQGENLSITEANVYDATNIRLRNIQVSYDIPQRWIKNTAFQRASIGLSCNNVWMISSHLHGIDPESVYATGSNAVGYENGSPPTSRVVMFNLSLSF